MEFSGKGNTGWFTHDRFGMFIHWGLYALGARQEWVKSLEKMTDEEYQPYFDHFNPKLFAPKEWARAAGEAGMKYFVITAKHHDGFCMWDSRYTDYKITNTAFGRDAIREIVDAFRAEGLHVGLYYSLIDWHHPEFPIDSFHPRRDWEDRVERNRSRDMKKYAQYMRDQITELLTGYGKIDIMWFDFSYPTEGHTPEPDGRPWIGKGRNEWESEKLVKLVRSLQPGIVIDNRMDLPEAADITTPEQHTPDECPCDAAGNPLVWESCHTFSGSWGYARDEYSWKTGRQCIELLINHVSRGGNLLMNVGPTAQGYLDIRARERLAAFAEWMKFNSDSIYGCGQAPAEFPEPKNARYTYNPETNRLYLHLFSWPNKHIHLADLAGKVRYAQMLADGSEIHVRRPPSQEEAAMHSLTPAGAVTLEIPVQPPLEGTEIPVIELILKE